MKLLFLGTPQSAVPILEALIASSHEVVGVVSQPARKSGRGQDIQDSAVTTFAIKNKIPTFSPEKIDQDYFDNYLNQLDAKVAIVVAFGQILDRSILDSLEYGWLNIHYSKLPKYRGAAPVQRAIMNGDGNSGITIFQIDEGLDTGPILAQYDYVIDDSFGTQRVLNDMNDLGSKKIIDVLDSIDSKSITVTPQQGETSSANKINESDMKIDWTKEASEIKNLIRSGTRNNCAWTIFQGQKIKIVSCAQIQNTTELNPGHIVIVNKKIQISCGSVQLIIDQVIPEGKKQMDAYSWVNGIQDKKDLVFT